MLIYIILGIIQGIMEPIPVSSSGHLLVFQELLGSIDKIDFGILATITNFGSLIAICFLFRERILKLIKNFFEFFKEETKETKQDFKYCLLIIIATIPAGLIGIVVEKMGLFNFLEENVKYVGITLLITALFLFIIKDFKGKKNNNQITLKDSIIIGLFQVVSLLPGISRSGATIVGGMFRSLKRETAFDFSFMLYIPISIATTLLGVKDLFTSNLSIITIFYYLIAMICAGIFTYIFTKWFKKIVTEGKLIYFVYYCLIVGILIILFI